MRVAGGTAPVSRAATATLREYFALYQRQGNAIGGGRDGRKDYRPSLTGSGRC